MRECKPTVMFVGGLMLPKICGTLNVPLSEKNVKLYHCYGTLDPTVIKTESEKTSDRK
jgi:hypothetical protein